MQEHSWLVSVLDDLEAYAKTNELPALSEELTKTKLTAMAEIGGLRMSQQSTKRETTQH